MMPRFAKDILSQIENYRVIDYPKKDVGGIYVVTDIDNVPSNRPGFYVMAYGREPIFTLDISATNGYVAGPMIFGEYEGLNTFRHDFNPVGDNRSVTIETCVVKQSRNGREKQVRNLFLKFHSNLREKCLGLGMTPAKEG